jgi:hypothetical protein
MTNINFAALIEPVARRLWGEPNARLCKKGKELRWGNHGSRSVDLEKGVWFDHETNEGGDVRALIKRETGFVLDDAIEWLKEENFINGKTDAEGLGRIVAAYDYFDEAGKLLFRVARFEPKNFRQCRPDGRGGWIWDLKGTRRVLYRLSELIEGVAAGHPVLIVEGEKDVDNVRKLGLVATTNPGGASKGKKSKWRSEYNEHLRGADVILVPDNDEPGWKHVNAIGASLTGIAARIRVLMLPGAKDASEWIAAGGTREQLDALIEAAPPWMAPTKEENAAGADKDDTDKDVANAAEQDLIDALARMSPIDYDRRREEEAGRLGVRRGTLDAEVNARRAQLEAETPPLFAHWIVEPWPEPVDGDALLLMLVRRIERHVKFGSAEAGAAALWTLQTWVHEAVAVHSPILMATSAEANSGKTTLLNLTRFLVWHGLVAIGISEAALFRSIEALSPTILVDEADVILIENEPLRAVMNSGWTRGAGVLRCIGDDLKPHLFSTFCPKAIGLKGRRLPDTTLSRAIILELRRKKPGESVEHFRCIDDAELAELRQRQLRWANDNEEVLEEALRTARSSMPLGFDNRLGDNWELLLAIADVCGGEWPDRARDAAIKLSSAAIDDLSIGARLLADVRRLFRDRGDPDCLLSVTIVGELVADPEGPWIEYSRGKPMTQNRLAKLLGNFGVYSETVHPSEGPHGRGYKRVWLEDAWERYLPGTPSPPPTFLK